MFLHENLDFIFKKYCFQTKFSILNLKILFPNKNLVSKRNIFIIANFMNETYSVLFCHTYGYQLTINTNPISSCGWRQRNYDSFESSDRKEDLIGKYFKNGYNYQKICLFLEKFHGIKVSLRTFEGRLAQYVLEKVRTDISDEMLYRYVQKLSGKLISGIPGTKSVWHMVSQWHNSEVLAKMKWPNLFCNKADKSNR